MGSMATGWLGAGGLGDDAAALGLVCVTGASVVGALREQAEGPRRRAPRTPSPHALGRRPLTTAAS